jgi:hypothetical protein
LKVSQVQRTKATSNEIAIRTDDRAGGRRTITASSWQYGSKRVPVLRFTIFPRDRERRHCASDHKSKSLRLIHLVRLAR